MFAVIHMSVIQIQSLQMSVYCNIAMDFVNIERVEAELCQKKMLTKNLVYNEENKILQRGI